MNQNVIHGEAFAFIRWINPDYIEVPENWDGRGPIVDTTLIHRSNIVGYANTLLHLAAEQDQL